MLQTAAVVHTTATTNPTVFLGIINHSLVNGIVLPAGVR
jgi:hypothetical protein